MKKSLHLAPGKEKAVLRHHPWIFSGAVRRTEGSPQPGDLVDVYSSNGQWLAVGHYQDDTIVCKVLSFQTDSIDEGFFRRRLQSAIDYRRRLLALPEAGRYTGASPRAATNVVRLVHAEATVCRDWSATGMEDYW